MKRIIYLLFFIGILCSCESYTSEILYNYDVCYPDTTITYNDVKSVKYNVSKKTKNFPDINVYSYSVSGTNFLTYCVGNSKINIISTTAPIRLNNYSVITTNNKK